MHPCYLYAFILILTVAGTADIWTTQTHGLTLAAATQTPIHTHAELTPSYLVKYLETEFDEKTDQTALLMHVQGIARQILYPAIPCSSLLHACSPPQPL